ncbi:MAG: DEAD/DEAH box helicase [Draconibacterium sp.]|nr:MAG: DEAD/DEAH box helicase [Draconibacterium sp.]
MLDEADEMLTMGFKDDLESILSSTPDSRRTFLFSATMTKTVQQLANQYMHDDVLIKVEGSNRGVDNIEHIYHLVHERNRYPALKRVVDLVPDVYGIVFCRTRQDCKNVAGKLMQDGYNADALHGDLSQAQRDYVMQRFRENQLQLLVATDVAARGIDVNDLTHVINYNLPDEAEAYIHRSGRTGRAGKKGISVSIINMKEKGKLRNVEKAVKVKFTQMPVPAGIEICERQLMHFMDKIQSVQVDSEQIDKYLPAIYEKLEHLNREELIQHFVTAEFNRFLSYYQHAEDVNVAKDDNRKQGKRSVDVDFVRVFINCGKNQRLDALALIKLINRTTRDKVDIGKIDIQRNFSFFEIDGQFSKKIIKKLNKMKFEGIALEVGVAEGVEKKRKRGKRKSKHSEDNLSFYAKKNKNKKSRKKRKGKKR